MRKLAAPCTTYYVRSNPHNLLHRFPAPDGHMEPVTDLHGPIWQGATVLIVDNERVIRSLLRRSSTWRPCQEIIGQLPMAA